MTADIPPQATRQCAVKFSLNRGPVRYQWHNMWAAAVATAAMCVSEGKDGRALIDCKVLQLPLCIVIANAMYSGHWLNTRRSAQDTDCKAWRTWYAIRKCYFLEQQVGDK